MGIVLINLNEIVDNNVKGNGGRDPDKELSLITLTDLKSSDQLQRIINLEKNLEKHVVEITERL